MTVGCEQEEEVGNWRGVRSNFLLEVVKGHGQGEGLIPGPVLGKEDGLDSSDYCWCRLLL